MLCCSIARTPAEKVWFGRDRGRGCGCELLLKEKGRKLRVGRDEKISTDACSLEDKAGTREESASSRLCKKRPTQ